MTLTKTLKDQSYDLIQGPARNHKLLQLWVRRGTKKEAISYYSNISHAFQSSSPLNENENPALDVTSTKKDEYGFNIGITILEDILKAMGLANVELSVKMKSGRSVSVSYENAVTRDVPIGELNQYFSTADFLHPNPELLQDANWNNILVVSGVMYAKNLVVEIDTNFDINADIAASLNLAADGRLEFTVASQQKLRMVSSGGNFFPIAIQAATVRYEKGIFRGLDVVTDTQNIF